MNISIKEGNTTTTYQAAYPVGVQKTHDGGLDQAKVVIRNIARKEAFEPFTLVPYFEGQSWIIARDDVERHKYNGKATHTLMLLEASKQLERIVCGAKTFTRPLVTVYAPIPVIPTYQDGEVTGNGTVGSWVTIDTPLIYPEGVSYKSPLTKDGSLTITSDVSWELRSSEGSPIQQITGTSVSYKKNNLPSTQVNGTETISLADADTITVEYKGWCRFQDPSYPDVYHTYYNRTLFEIDVFASAISKDPLTIFETVDRLLITAEVPSVRAIEDGERKYMHVSEAGNLGLYIEDCINTKDIVAPEFSFANGATLKENLDEIAKVMHAKTKVYYSSYDDRFYIYFVPLTTQETAVIRGTKIGDITAYDAEKYGGRVETNASNLIIANKDEGAVTEPCLIAYGSQSNFLPMKSLRCSATEVRINEETGEIETDFPIRRVTKLYMSNLATGEKVDISKYVNELTRYNALSSYEKAGGRSYSIYYKQGEKNVRGLFFKAQTAASVISPALERYAIVNIFNEVTNSNYTGIGEAVGVASLCFNIEYEPYLDVRLVGSRADGKGDKITSVANQAANVVDKDSLGAFIRGVAEQMSSDSPIETYIMRNDENIPKVGSLYDTHTYISTISYEIYPYFKKASFHLSEHYNKFGSRVQVPNQVRQYEIDTKNVFQRSVLSVDTVKFSYERDLGTDNFFLSRDTFWMYDHLMRYPAFSAYDTSVSAAVCKTYGSAGDKNDTPTISMNKSMPTVLLPVVSFGFANSLAFVFRYEDNFSAGSKARLISNHLAFQEYVECGDEYGDAGYLDFVLANGIAAPANLEELKSEARSYPVLLSNRSAANEFIARRIPLFKDSREAITVVHQILFQSSDIFITDEFFKSNPMVSKGNGSNAYMLLYDVENPFNPLTGQTSVNAMGAYDGLRLDTSDGMRLVGTVEYPTHKAWALVSAASQKILLSSNKPFSPIYLSHFTDHAYRQI